MATLLKNQSCWIGRFKVLVDKATGLLTMLASLMILPQSLVAASVKLPDLGVNSSSVFSPELDRRIGAAFMRQVRSGLSVIDDPEMQAYVRELGLKLASNSDRPELRFNFFLVDNQVITRLPDPEAT